MGDISNKYGQPLWVLGHQIRLLEPVGDTSMVEVTSRPNVPGPPPHKHDGCSEFFYIIRGEMTYTIDGVTEVMAAGQYRTIRPGVEHTFINTGDTDAVWLTGFGPKGFEQFFADFGVDATEDGAFERSVAPDVLQQVGVSSESYGMTITAPPPA